MAKHEREVNIRKLAEADAMMAQLLAEEEEEKKAQLAKSIGLGLGLGLR